MTGRSKPAVRVDDVNKMIADVDAYDRQQARLAINGGVKAAEAQWIATQFISEALALELMAVAQSNRSSAEIAAYLRALAGAVEAQADVH